MTTPSSFGNRRSIRLPAFDYATPGAYFVTIVTHERMLIFGDVRGDDVRLQPVRRIVDDEWRKTPTLRPQVELDEFVVMPNHFHAIVWLGPKDESAGKAPTLSK